MFGACIFSRVQLFATLCCSPPDSPVHEITQVGILEWVAISSSKVSTQSRDQVSFSCIGRQILSYYLLVYYSVVASLIMEMV